MNNMDETYPHNETHLSLNKVHPNIVLKTQLNSHYRHKNDVFKKAKAEIGLHSPTTSQEAGEDYGTLEYVMTWQMTNTPIWNSAASLMAIGQQILTPMQSRIWEFWGKLYLGGK